MLSKEHVIPMGLGGKYILPNASCESCRQITSAFETIALRHVLGPGRYQTGIKPKKKHSRPKSWPAHKVLPDGTKKKVQIPIDELPFFMPFPTFKAFPVVSALMPKGHKATEKEGALIVGNNPSYAEQTLKKYGADHFPIRNDHHAFSRMLAKIALSYCVKHFGYGCVLPLVGPLIVEPIVNYVPAVASSERVLKSTDRLSVNGGAILGHGSGGFVLSRAA